MFLFNGWLPQLPMLFVVILFKLYNVLNKSTVHKLHSTDYINKNVNKCDVLADLYVDYKIVW